MALFNYLGNDTRKTNKKLFTKKKTCNTFSVLLKSYMVYQMTTLTVITITVFYKFFSLLIEFFSGLLAIAFPTDVECKQDQNNTSLVVHYNLKV